MSLCRRRLFRLVELAGGARHLEEDVDRVLLPDAAEVERISAVTLEIERQNAAAAAAAERLHGATAKLAVSRARLQLQLAALREAQALVRRTFWVVPGI